MIERNGVFGQSVGILLPLQCKLKVNRIKLHTGIWLSKSVVCKGLSDIWHDKYENKGNLCKPEVAIFVVILEKHTLKLHILE